MKKISIAILFLVVALASCKKTPEVNLKYVDVERDLITVGMTSATVQCDYDYIATLKKAYFYYGEGANEADMNTAEMRVVQNTLYVDLTGLKANTTYSYFYEFHNGFNSMRTALKTFKTETLPEGVTIPTVITAEVMEITSNSAKSGGEVTDDGGAEVTERGICWGANANPTLSGSHVTAGTGMGAFTAIMNGLEVGTTYHVRAYATNEKGTAYGLDREFVTIGSGGGCDYEYVDLGLPSGTLWATCNIGASSPEEYGDYFAWGEIQPKSAYDWNTYQYCNGSIMTLTKYCNDANYGYNGFSDTLITLLPEDDAATANWCNEWCIPTKAQWEELVNNTTIVWTTQNGVRGRLLTASNGNCLFLPAAGYFYGSNLNAAGSGSRYWSSSLYTITDGTYNAWNFYFSSEEYHIHGGNRDDGISVRPVRKNEFPVPPSNVPEGAINGLFTINENGDQVYFSQGNLQYQASTNTWRFAEHQWDYISTQTPNDLGYIAGTVSGSDNINISPTYNGWIDLFGWGTSGWNCGNTYYHPWDDWEPEPGNEVEYHLHSLYGPPGEYNLADSYANSDWGVYNAIINGGNRPGIWRTLSIEEWEHLLFSRSTFSNARFAIACVNDVNGVILLPDGWNSDNFELANINHVWADYGDNAISATEWCMLEQFGAVFLPAAGCRSKWYEDGMVHVYNGNITGDYWSVSCDPELTVAHIIDFSGGMTTPAVNSNSSLRPAGLSVRLVQDANPQNKAK